MPTVKLRPITPGQRYRNAPDFKEVTKSTPEKALTKANNKNGGRNAQGRMTVRNVGGGHKRKYRHLDFKRDKFDIPAKVAAVEYDPNRTSRIALLHYVDGEKRYVLAAEKMAVGSQVLSSQKAIEPKAGNAMPLRFMPLGTVIHNVEMHPGRGGIIARSAGGYAQLSAKETRYAVLKMPSGETRRVLLDCMATVGSVGNASHEIETLGKAGRNRWKGNRPRVRGVAMNPVDHPMGGGEGKASGGHPRSRTGIMAKGQKTRRPKKQSNRLIINRRK